MVNALRWDPMLKRWRVTTSRGDEIRSRFVILAAGILNKPKLPGIPGIKDFEGKLFHTARWDYEYTGGNARGDLSKLADKRVGLIGTGATAIQCVPYLGEYAQSLYAFQRTPSYGCKRPCFSDTYLPTFNRPNVTRGCAWKWTDGSPVGENLAARLAGSASAEFPDRLKRTIRT
jgi:cation diffusion facilitator CzcD-associated flavoprotein CzcO